MTSPAPLPIALPAHSRRKPKVTRRPGTRQFAMAAIVSVALSAAPALASGKKPSKETAYQPTMPVAPVAHPADGSIFNISSGYAPLYGGTRAHMVGDALTILLVETTTAAKTVVSNSSKTGGVGITPPKAGPLAANPDALNAASNSSFKGEGDASQTNSLSSTLSVTIAEVRPNGTALVRGEKRMLLSQGDEWIQVSGIVRLADIDQDNNIPSSKIADAKIEYSGKGALQRATKQGWLGRIFNIVSPF